MRLTQFLSFALLLTTVSLFYSCQEEDVAIDTSVPTNGGSPFDEKQFLKLNESLITGKEWFRLPMPCPKPRKQELFVIGKQCEPGILDATLYNSKIIDLSVEIFFLQKDQPDKIYASSNEKYGGDLEIIDNYARAYVSVVDESLAELPLMQRTTILYRDQFGERRKGIIEEEFSSGK